MEWVILFVLSWTLMLLLADWKQFHINLWAGITAALMQEFIDAQFISHKLYMINNPVVCIFGSSLFFVLGPIFVIGVLLAQYHPVKKASVIFHVFFITALYSFTEYILILRNALVYYNWHFIDSIIINILAISFISWFCIVVLAKRKV